MDGGTNSGRAARLMEILGLTEDELCRALDADALTLLSGQLDHRPELPILLTMLNEALETSEVSMLQRWVRAGGPGARPLDALLDRDFAAFEDALGEFSQHGFVLRGGGRKNIGGEGGKGKMGGDDRLGGGDGMGETGG